MFSEKIPWLQWLENNVFPAIYWSHFTPHLQVTGVAFGSPIISSLVPSRGGSRGCGSAVSGVGVRFLASPPKVYWSLILLMVQKSGVHQLRLVVYPILYRVLIHPRWLFGIFEPSTVSCIYLIYLFNDGPQFCESTAWFQFSGINPLLPVGQDFLPNGEVHLLNWSQKNHWLQKIHQKSEHGDLVEEWLLLIVFCCYEISWPKNCYENITYIDLLSSQMDSFPNIWHPLFVELACWLVVEPTHLKNMLVKLGIFPHKSGWKFQKIFEESHHLGIVMVYYNALYNWVGFHPLYNPTQHGIHPTILVAFIEPSNISFGATAYLVTYIGRPGTSCLCTSSLQRHWAPLTPAVVKSLAS